ncbi:MAG: hypothetical protein Q7S92_04740 [Candidatus Diapherotrites archaeon]|nr:hypothetical protein [Candidatus Diapherotrites archaeon]
MLELRKPLVIEKRARKGTPLSEEAKRKISAARKRWLAENSGRLRKESRARVVKELQALRTRNEAINYEYIRKRYPKLGRSARHAFGTYEKAITEGLGLSYDQVKVSEEKRVQRVQKGSAKYWEKFDTPGSRRRRTHAWISSGYLASKKTQFRRMAEILSLRLQGFQTRTIAQQLKVHPNEVHRRINQIRAVAVPELAEQLLLIQRRLKNQQRLPQIDGAQILSRDSANQFAREFQKTQLKKFNEDRKQAGKLALQGKTNLEIGIALGLPSEEVQIYLKSLPIQILEKIRILKLRQALMRTKAVRGQ